MQKTFISLVLSLLMLSAPAIEAKQRLSSVKEDTKQITVWNTFSESVYALHKWMISQHEVRTEESSGGYRKGYLGGPDFYREVKYIDASNGQLLSQIQWEKENPDTLHTIETYLYNKDGQLSIDYLVAYLPAFRNAPVQTLVNFHSFNDGLHAFRQFDASGELTYEQCSGEHISGDVDISLEDYELITPTEDGEKIIASEAYIACFGTLPSKAGTYLDPLSNIPASAKSVQSIDDNTSDFVENKILSLTKQIEQYPNKANLYLERGKFNLRMLEFDAVVADTTKAVEMDETLVEAYYWRGMALGRQRKLEAAIDDLTIFLRHKPNDSRAYTKRGVRYIWKGDLVNAEKDLRRAIELDANNAEAHDDLGVIVAQRGELTKAAEHFSTTIKLDPSYAKGHQNLAMTRFMQGEFIPAMNAVNSSLALQTNNRSALLLKAEILYALGRDAEADQIKAEAEFMTKASWQERFHVEP